MKDLLNFLLQGILGEQKFEIVENIEGDRINFSIETADENKGIIIGKGGRMISSLRNLLKIRATLEKKGVFLNIN